VNAIPPKACWYDSSGNPQQPPPDTATGNTIVVWCSMVWNPSSTSTREITYSACLYTTTPTPTTAATCAANPVLQAVVTFDDYTTPVVTPAPSPVQCQNTCGQSMTVNSWQWSPTVPAVTSISPKTTTIQGGTPVTITGTGFVPGSSVNFVQEIGGANSGPASANIVFTQPATCVSVQPGNTCTQLTTTTPPVTSGTAYYVTVTTPSGTSPYVAPNGTSFDMLYSTAVPTVTAISGPNMSGNIPQGSIAGGSRITLTGTGFYSTTPFPTIVRLWSGNTAIVATNVQVTSGTQLTATTPPAPSVGNWYVQVSTAAGASTGTGVQFAYGAQQPLVISLSPSSGGPTSGVSQITITGSNFLAGTATSVQFFVNSGGAPSGNGIAAAQPSVTSPTAMTVVLPTSKRTKGTSYFPVVTTTVSGTTSSSQTYNLPTDIFTYTG
jgi:hypothetical protein